MIVCVETLIVMKSLFLGNMKKKKARVLFASTSNGVTCKNTEKWEDKYASILNRIKNNV